MFCSKCGKELPDDAAFCSYCGNQTSNSKAIQPAPTPQPMYVPQPPQPTYVPQSPPAAYASAQSPFIVSNNGCILTKKENYTIIVTGLIYIVAGIISAISIIVSGSVLQFDSIEDGEKLTIVSAILGLCLNAFFGVAAILNKRWAFLTIRVFEILGIISNGLSLIFVLLQISSVSANQNVRIDVFDLLILLLVVGYEVLMIIFTSACAKSLSWDVQNSRRKSADRNCPKPTVKHYANINRREGWECAKCGAHNSNGDSFCKDCGSYK